MARKRTISPLLWENEDAQVLTDAAFRVWIGLWSVSDRNGVFEWRPRKWVLRFAPRTQEDPDQVFQQLLDVRFIASFEAQGEPYGFCVKWSKHQDPHINEAPQYPMPTGDPRFTPCPPRGWTKANSKWAFEVYGLTPGGSTGASTGASTGFNPSCPSGPSRPSRPSGEKIKRGLGQEGEDLEHVPTPPEPAPGLDSRPTHPAEVSPIGDLDELGDDRLPLVLDSRGRR